LQLYYLKSLELFYFLGGIILKNYFKETIIFMLIIFGSTMYNTRSIHAADSSNNSVSVLDEMSKTEESIKNNFDYSNGDLFTNSVEKNNTVLAAAAGATLVNDWTTFTKAMQDSSVTNIYVENNLTATGNITVSGNKAIDFNNNYLDIANRYIRINSPYQVNISNIIISGSRNNVYSFTGTGTINFTENLSSTSTNLSNIANMTGGTVTLDSLTMNFDNGTNRNEAITAKNFTITNKSRIVTNSEKFFGSTVPANVGGSILIDKQSNIENNSLKKSTGNGYGQVWNITQKCDFFIKGSGTKLTITGDGTQQASNGGIFLLQADSSTINVLDGASLDVHSLNTSAILLQSQYGIFNIDNKSEVNVTQDNDNNYSLGASIRFRDRGDMTFNITNSSKLNVLKKQGRAPAIRMYGGNNSINVSDDSDFTVHNKGDGRYRNGGGDNRNQGILYTLGGDNSFKTSGENANISIISDYGPTIDSGNNSLNVDIEEGTYFVARGATAGSNEGIFNSSLLNFQMNTVKYFDFRNSNRGSIFNANSSSKFNSSNSDISVWNKDSDLNSNASQHWDQVTFSLVNTNLNRIDSSTSSEMLTNWGSTSNYSRISANNQGPIVDQLRVPTNADKSVFAHMSIPQGKYDEPTPAGNNAASLKLDIYSSNGKLTQQLSGKTQTQSIYGEPSATGWVKVALPNNKFLNEGDKVKVSSAWLGSVSENNAKIKSSSEDIKTDEKTVFGIIPPKPAVINDKVESTTKNLNGKGTPNTKVFLYINNTDSGITANIDDEGNFTLALPNDLKKGDKLQFLLQDKKGAAKGVINPPVTNTTIGNIEPTSNLPYHDTVFPAGTIIEVTGSLTLAEYPQTFDFGKQKIGIREQIFWPKIIGNLKVIDTRNNSEGWQVKLTETKPLTSDKEELDGVLYYQDGQTDTPLGEDAIVVFKKGTSSDGIYQILDHWGEANKKGLKAKVPIEKQRTGQYKGTLKWSLEAVPGNS